MDTEEIKLIITSKEPEKTEIYQKFQVYSQGINLLQP